MEPQLRDGDGSWPKTLHESSSFLVRCRTPCLAMHGLKYPLSTNHSAVLALAVLWPIRGQPGLALRPLYHLTTSIDHSSLLLISISSYFLLTPNSLPCRKTDRQTDRSTMALITQRRLSTSWLWVINSHCSFTSRHWSLFLDCNLLCLTCVLEGACRQQEQRNFQHGDLWCLGRAVDPQKPS